MPDEIGGQLRTELAAAWAKDGINYPSDRLPDAVADYADLKHFLGVIAAAMPCPIGTPAGAPDLARPDPVGG